jgi:hypothetical protein
MAEDIRPAEDLERSAPCPMLFVTARASDVAVKKFEKKINLNMRILK